MKFLKDNKAILIVVIVSVFLCLSPTLVAVLALLAIAYIASVNSDKRTEILDKLKDIFIERK